MYPNLNTGALGIRANLPEAITLAHDHGFAGIDFSMVEAANLVDTHSLDYVRELFISANVRPGSWDFPVEFRRDEATWRHGLEALPRLARHRSDLGL